MKAVVIAAIVCILVFAAILASPLGFLFSPAGNAIQEAVSQVKSDYADEIARIQEEATYDSCSLTEDFAGWKDVIAVFAVKNEISLNNIKQSMSIQQKLAFYNVFWDMHTISSYTEEQTVTVEDEQGKPVEVTTVVLYITVTHKDPVSMASYYGFDLEEREQLYFLLEQEDALWANILSSYE